MYLSRPFLTVQKEAQGTNSATTGITPVGANILDLETNTSQIIVHNKDSTDTLFFMSYNSSLDATIDLVETVEISAGAYLTLSLGVRSASVGVRRVVGFNTTASAINYKVTQIFNIEE